MISTGLISLWGMLPGRIFTVIFIRALTWAIKERIKRAIAAAPKSWLGKAVIGLWTIGSFILLWHFKKTHPYKVWKDELQPWEDR